VSTCRSCGAPVEWVRTTEGRTMPLDPDPRLDGNLERTGSRSRTRQGTEVDVVRVVPTGDEPLPGIDPPDRFVSHFATCPHADRWRRDR
jgi:hypothetical protein